MVCQAGPVLSGFLTFNVGSTIFQVKELGSEGG